jgi:hypothetical protein
MIQKKILFKISIVFLCTLVYSCNNSSRSNTDITIYTFFENILSLFAEIPVQYHTHPSTELVYDIRRLLMKGNCDNSRFILIDNLKNYIIISDKNGIEIFKTGGKGKGPGEYESLMWGHIGSDKRLYIIDGLQFRISIYDIEENYINLISTINYNNPSKYFLSSIYVTDYGTYGVYQESEGFHTPENRFLLYQLDKTFSPTKRLLEMPGHERQKYKSAEFDLYTPHKYRNQTHWHVDNGWFYYATSDNSTIYRYNLQTSEIQKLSFLQLNRRENSLQFSTAVKQYYSTESNDPYWEALHDIDYLPLIIGLLVHENNIYLTLLPTPGIDGVILVVNIEEEKVKYFRSPQEFVPNIKCGNVVYGIDFRVNEDYQIVEIEFDDF